jgi:hypothetical protein
MENRMFRGRPTDKLIIRIERDTIEAIDNATRSQPGLPPGNRSEFIRQAIEARLSQGTPPRREARGRRPRSSFR